MKHSDFAWLSSTAKAVLLLAIIAFLGKVPAYATDHPLVVAYIDGDTLFSWQEGATTPRTIAKGNIAHPLLSPDATQIIFQQDKDLWIAALANTDKPAKALATADMLDVAPDKSRFVLDSQWLDSKTVIFNTYHYHPTTPAQ